MSLPNEEVLALRECARIIAPSLGADERATYSLNTESKIAEGRTLNPYRTQHLASLYFPSAPERAKEFLDEIGRARERGALVSKIPDGLLLTDLVMWADCPAVPKDSPLQHWLPKSMHERDGTAVSQATQGHRFNKDDFLALIASRFDTHENPHARLHWHEVRDDGVYVRRSTDAERRTGIDGNPVEHPAGEPNVPALSFPFTLDEFLALEATAGIVAQMGPYDVSRLWERNERAAWSLATETLDLMAEGSPRWTLEQAAHSISDQRRDELRSSGNVGTDAQEATLLGQMLDAAADGTLVVRHPHTDLPYRPTVVRRFYELVTREDVNSWLDAIGAGYRWQGRTTGFETLSELVHNGGPIDWNYWRHITNIDPMQAAMLANRIDPIKWKVGQYHGGEWTADLRDRIVRLEQLLRSQRAEWSLSDLARVLGSNAPARMLAVVAMKGGAPDGEPAAAPPVEVAQADAGDDAPVSSMVGAHGDAAAGTADQSAPAPTTALRARWRLLPLQRADDLRRALHAFLERADVTNAPPTASQVLVAWMAQRPSGVTRVTANEANYLDRHGVEQSATLEALSERIARSIERIPQ